MAVAPRLSPITVISRAGLPDSWPSGAYLLRIALRADLELAFGRFRGGSSVRLPGGEYVYVGSAMGRRGWPLAARLLRHATRSGDGPPHAIRAELVARLSEIGAGRRVVPPRSKRRHWHVDHLLDEAAAELSHVILVPAEVRLEPKLARLLAADPHTAVVVKELGAADVPGGTHILRVLADEAWWLRLVDRVR